MNRLLTSAALATFALILLAGCAGKPESAPMSLRAGDPHSTEPNRIICRQLAPPTGSHIPTDKEVCHTFAQWQEMEKRSKEVMQRGEHQPGQGG